MKDRVRDTYAVEVGRRLLIAREALGLSQAELARLLDIDAQRLSHWELGKHHLPAPFAFRIFQLTRVNSDWLHLGDPSRLPADIYAIVVKEMHAQKMRVPKPRIPRPPREKPNPRLRPQKPRKKPQSDGPGDR